MAKRSIRKKRHSQTMAYVITFAIGTSFISGYTVPVRAELVEGQEIANNYVARDSLQPIGNAYSIKTLLEWTPESDEAVRYNRATVKLKDRFTGPVVNENANPNAKIMNCALTNPQTDNAPSQGGDTENAYVFSYWQYIDSYVYWGGSAKGIFVPPTADVIDVGHKNGVPVLGTVGFPWGSSAGGEYVKQVREFLFKNEDGSFPVADKMIEMARFYGFDGWFINQESYGCSKTDADLMVEFFTYMHEKDPNIRIGWYDSMTTDGPVSYQNALNHRNVGFFQNNGKRVIDEFFLNYNWGINEVNTSVETAKSVGRSQYDVYAGVEVQQNAYNDNFPVQNLLDAEGKLKLSLAMYCPNSTFSMSKDILDFYKHDQKFWVGPTGDPSKTDTSERWVGLANYVADKSAINKLPFVTNFNLGHGISYYIDGNLLRNKEWNNRALQDYLPTWRWIVESNGSKLIPEFDRSDAYNGGSSLMVNGNLEAANPNHIKLYSTNLEINNENTEISITYKTPLNKNNMKIGLCFGDDYDESSFTFLEVKDGSKGEWTTSKISLKDYVGQKISAISLKFESQEDINDFKINIGNISIKENSEKTILPAPNKVVLDDQLLHNAKNAEARIYWDDVQNAEFYEIYRVKPDGNKEFVGATYNNSYYIPPFDRYENESEFNFEVVGVDKNFNRGEAQTLKFKWSIPADSTEVPNKEQPINLALNKNVKASSQNAGEPAIKAVDGTVENNSKWCTTTGMYGGWLEVDLGEEKTIQRWVTMHGEAGGEAKDTNTKDFRLQVLDKNGEFKDVDVVRDNEEGIVDRNLKEPVTGQVFRLYIDHPGISPWAAIRIYEFQLFKDSYTPTTDNIPMNTVKATNNIGANDEVLFRNVPRGYEVLLYKNIKDTEPFVKKVSEGGEVRFTGLDFGEEEGRVYFATKQDGKEQSIKLSVSYDNENWDVTKIPNNFTISKYEINGRSSILNSYYATLDIGDLKPGDIVNYYKNIDDEFPTKVSIPVLDNKTSTVLQPLILNNSGGDIILQVKRQGMKATPRFKVSYKDTGESSSKGNLDIIVKSNSNIPVNEGVFEVIKDGEVVENITTDNLGKGKVELDPGVYSIIYTGNLDDYKVNDYLQEVEIEKPFDSVVKNFNLEKLDNENEEKPQPPQEEIPTIKPDNEKEQSDKNIIDSGKKDENKKNKEVKSKGILPKTGGTASGAVLGIAGLLTSLGVLIARKKK
ncbi:discoidin domain-containing protein [Clostridium septicum]|uniref:endo-beta-N-acetylglucosaminidase n=1 Tax=Clostridium septicum TaxID=1504 RepID=UPI00272DFCF9|nr:discoidin domain-containing protein [Clostridium septicum]WLF70675.1 discoidin domain-containing protein [Clostridium septicum]